MSTRLTVVGSTKSIVSDSIGHLLQALGAAGTTVGSLNFEEGPLWVRGSRAFARTGLLRTAPRLSPGSVETAFLGLSTSLLDKLDDRALDAACPARRAHRC